MKGHGKDPLAAALALAELCGPVAFSHFGPDGQPVGKPRHAPWVQVAAVSQEQTKNTFSLFPVMISAELKADYGLDINKTIIYANGGIGRIEAVTSSPASMEGNRPTFVIRNETQEWVETVGGDDMANVIEGNVKKSPGGVARVLDICNAHVPGRDSIAERAWDAWNAVEAGQAVDVGMLYDSIEAPADTPVSEIPNKREDPEGYELGIQRLREGLIVARGDTLRHDIDTIIESLLDVRNEITESRRKFLNQVNASEDAWIAPWEWDRCQAITDLEKGETITLGFDGSKSSDHTALVACRVSDGALFVIKTWNPLNYAGEVVPREQVDAMVHWAFGRYNVVAMRADVKEFESYVDQWGQKYRKQMVVNATPKQPIAYDMRAEQKRFALDCEKFLDAVLEQELVHDGDRLLRQHVLNAVRNPTQWDTISIRKVSKDSSKKIDAAVCAVLAYGARQEVLMSNKMRTKRAAVLRG
jgi:phage terminase large subunit-like protein